MLRRIEVDRAALTDNEYEQFIDAARSRGFRVGWREFYVCIRGLTEAQAIFIRDALLEMGIHSSIGIEEPDVPVVCVQ